MMLAWARKGEDIPEWRSLGLFVLTLHQAYPLALDTSPETCHYRQRTRVQPVPGYCQEVTQQPHHRDHDSWYRLG